MIIYMILGTITFLIFTFLYLGANNSVSEAMMVCKIETEEEKAKSLMIEMTLLAKEVEMKKAMNDKSYLKKAKKLKKNYDNANKMATTYKKGKVIGLDLIPVAGYQLMKLLGWDIRNKHIKKMYDKCLRFMEKREAINYTYFVYGTLFGHILLGLAMGFIAIGLVFAMGNDSALYIGLGVFGLISFLGYLPLDGVNAKIKKREEEIEKDFLQIVSQLTLLVVAGMEVGKAWQISSLGGRSTLYAEMNRVNIDLENNVNPPEAFGKFITRCNNKFTTRLATAIIQNMAKGNSEIVTLFTQLNSESWSEYKHGARRMSDKVQSKLFIPTMLMFLGILILVMLPVVGGFSI